MTGRAHALSACVLLGLVSQHRAAHTLIVQRLTNTTTESHFAWVVPACGHNLAW